MQFTTFALAALSLGSAIAGPISGFQGFDSAAAAVANARTIVEKQVTTITTLTKGPQDTETITKVQQSLLTVSHTVSGLSPFGLALGEIGSTPLSQEQLAAFPEFTDNFHGLFIGIQTIGKSVTDGKLDQDSLAQIKPELQLVLATAGPVARPFISFVQVVVPGSAKAFKQVTTILVSIQGLINLTVGPLSGLKLSI